MFIILFWIKEFYVSEVCVDNDKYAKKANQKDIIKLLRRNMKTCL